MAYRPPRPHETNEETYHAGGLEDEVAAILSLCLGIRAQAGDPSREFSSGGDPRGLPVAYAGDGRHPFLPPAGRHPVVPSAGGEHSLDQLAPFLSSADLPGPTVIALVRSARLYQAAMWVAEADPNQSWILLSSAVETAAGHWNEAAKSPLEGLRAWHPSLVKLLAKRGGEELAAEVAEKLNRISGATWKFVQFLNKFRPDPPPTRPPQFLQLDWHKGKEFRDDTEVLDGNRYEACVFTRCRLVYRGGEAPGLVGCAVEGCTWHFEDAAARTVAFLKGIRDGMGQGGRDLFDATFGGPTAGGSRRGGSSG